MKAIATETFLRRLLKENVVLLLVVMLVIIPLLSPFTEGASGRPLLHGLFESIGVLLLVVLLARADLQGGLPRLGYLIRSGVNAPLAAFLLWATLGALTAPDWAFATAELLRLGSGALIYFALALHLETRTQLSLLVDCLLGMVLLLTGYSFLFHGSESNSSAGMWSIFPSPHHLSAILTVLFPLLASLALGLQDLARRVRAIAAAIWSGIGLLLCLERSAWIGVGVGLLVWLYLAGRSPSPARASGSWRPTLIVALCCVLVAIGFLATTRVDAIVANRARDFSAAAHGRNYSFAWRVQKWRGTVAMAARRPLWGWGTGQYVLQQYAYTHLSSYPGNTTRTEREDVRRYGASFDDMAYNEYLQTAAELGFPGLALYLLVLASFFSKAGAALRRLPHGLRRATLLGCMAGVAAQMVDAMANGSWRYSECSIFFWLALGMGMAVARMAYPAPRVQQSDGRGNGAQQSRQNAPLTAMTSVGCKERSAASGVSGGRYPPRGSDASSVLEVQQSRRSEKGGGS